MYRNRSFLRDRKIRVYYNENELEEVKEGATSAGMQTAEFIREATVVVANYIRSRNGSRFSVAQLNAHLTMLATRSQFNELC